MRLTVGYKKKRKIALDFLIKIHLEDRFFIIEIRFCFSFLNTKSVFQNSNSDLPIESTHNFRAIFPIFHKYSQFFWTLLNRNKIIFTQPTILKLFDYLIKAIISTKFLQNWCMFSLRVAVLGRGRVRLRVSLSMSPLSGKFSYWQKHLK